MSSEVGAEVIEAARSGDPVARDQLVSAYLPLVYNVVGRALKGHADVDDVVQDTMIRALGGLGGLRDPSACRSWLVAIAMNQVRRHWRERQDAPVGGLGEVHEMPGPEPDFADLTIVRLGLEGQRKEVAEATRWLDDSEQEVLSLWWLEAGGELSRAEVAAALDLSPQHTAVRVQRTKDQLETARVVVRALSTTPLCGELRQLTGIWDGRPSALWRKRISRHARGCAGCSGHWSGLVPAEGLLVGLGLVPVAGALLGWRASTAAAAQLPMDPAGSAVPGDAWTHSADTTVLPAVDLGPAGAHGSAGATHGSAGTHAADGARGARHRARKRSRAARGAGIAALALAVGGSALLLVPGDKGHNDAGSSRTAPLAEETPSADEPTPDHTTTRPASRKESPTRRPVTKAPRTSKPTPRPSTSAPTAPPTRSAPTTAPPKADPGSGNSTAFAQQVMELVNIERGKVGCSPVRLNDKLNSAAQRHSDDMAARGYFDHTSPDGSDPGDRITAAGYPWRTYGENIAKGQQTPAAVMDSWMNSPGHRQNILNCDFTEMGVGVNRGSGGPTWTQAFGDR
ncbi:sigma-70 family RNA polymerase sigma factor [Streptomyces coffeae]|uniref:RNA polymerase sigma factor n=1 Tax=Streptomyces coffeae TaxID=621382 RepID=A0ABS1NNE2_9ACTN|nr:sigma-70 family RNA polymerase sigma factor [Streptomyces coffeae]MBL1101612.1 sigma-70 family RNA polymerase sigma factor [Streptomyces coffeae]